MKKIFYFSCIYLTCNSSFANNCPNVNKPLTPTSTTNKNDKGTGVECLNYQLANDVNSVIEFAKNSKDHLGKIENGDCLSKKDGGYFSNEPQLLENAIKTIKMNKCVVHNRDNSKLVCFGNITKDACLSNNTKAKSVTFIIGKQTGNYISLYPS